MLFDTIAAISTPLGEGAIGIVRISGQDSLDILSKIFKSISNKNVKDLANFSINYGYLYDNDILVDEVLVSIMKGKNTYSGEDIVEINCHGGYFITNKILGLVLKNGARAAEKGEFTRRAFLNGRIDLTQAEAVMDLIDSRSDMSANISVDQLRGDLKDKINDLKNKILNVAAHINVVLDYPEEGIEDPLPKDLIKDLNVVHSDIDLLIASYDKGKIIKNGIKTAIIGKPNVGKSSILNSFLREDRAIVTDIPGTTRDIIREDIKIKGIDLSLIDTAGIRDTKDAIENIGVKRSKEELQKADLILFVIDSARDIDKEDMDIYNSLSEDRFEKTIGIINKIDIQKSIDIKKLDKIKKWIKISALTKSGIEEMENEIYDYVIKEKIESIENKYIITNVRHIASLKKTKEAVENILDTIDKGLPMDLMAVDIKEALDSLGEITGEITSEDLLDRIFSSFCVGK